MTPLNTQGEMTIIISFMTMIVVITIVIKVREWRRLLGTNDDAAAAPAAADGHNGRDYGGDDDDDDDDDETHVLTVADHDAWSPGDDVTAHQNRADMARESQMLPQSLPGISKMVVVMMMMMMMMMIIMMMMMIRMMFMMMETRTHVLTVADHDPRSTGGDVKAHQNRADVAFESQILPENLQRVPIDHFHSPRLTPGHEARPFLHGIIHGHFDLSVAWDLPNQSPRS
jgi:hypothetical protein